MNDVITVRWTGAAGLVFNFRGENILVDPYYTRLGRWKPFFLKSTPDRDKIEAIIKKTGKISAVIVTHTHFDHAFDIPVVSEYTEGKITGSRSLDILMNLHGKKDRVTVCKGNETIELLPDVSVTMLPSVHGNVFFGTVPFKGEISENETLPMRVKSYRTGQVFAPEIKIGNRTFIHVGSAGFDEKALYGRRCDVLFLCVPGWKKMNGYPEKILQATGAETVVLFHYDDFFKQIEKGKPSKVIPMADIRGLSDKIRSISPDINIIIPDVDDELCF